MDAVGFWSCGIADIDCIRPLWEELNRYHHQRNTRFAEHYEKMTFEKRKAEFCALSASGSLRLDLAVDTASGRYVGYCAGSVSENKTGEIDSLFVTAAYRSRGIGTALVTRCLAWMDACGVVQKRVRVSTGNEDAFLFYRQFSFFPRLTVLEQTAGPQR